MRVLTTLRRARVAATAAATATVLAGGALSQPAARADTTASAAAKANAVLSKVHRLQSRALAAEKRYAAAFSAVSDSVNRAIAADQASQTVSDDAASAQQALVERARNLYESGGNLEVYAALLVDGSVSDFSSRAVIVSRVMAMQARNARVTSSRAAAFDAAAARAARLEHRRIGTERTVAAAASRVQAILSREQVLLRDANTHLAAVRAAQAAALQAAQAALASESAAFGSITTQQIAGLHVLPPSAPYLSLYHRAATTCPGLPWNVLAAIGQVESGHGRNPSTSSAGAMGPMQFEPATFRSYAVDGDHNGTADIMSPADSIYTAAHYLCANGAGRGPGPLSGAILHYNHAGWYVAMVLKLSGLYASSYA